MKVQMTYLIRLPSIYSKVWSILFIIDVQETAMELLYEWIDRWNEVVKILQDLSVFFWQPTVSFMNACDKKRWQALQLLSY
jgi:hypothetical protein